MSPILLCGLIHNYGICFEKYYTDESESVIIGNMQVNWVSYNERLEIC